MAHSLKDELSETKQRLTLKSFHRRKFTNCPISFNFKKPEALNFFPHRSWIFWTMELFQKLRLPPVRYFMLGCHYIWNVILGKRGKNSQNPKSDLGVVLELEHMKSLRFFWLWSTADQKNSEAAPLRCAMAACCHPSNSPSTAPALTFWPNSESKNCRGHPGIGFCQYETLTCPTLKRICLEKYDTISLTISTSTSQVLLATAGCIFGL